MFERGENHEILSYIFSYRHLENNKVKIKHFTI